MQRQSFHLRELVMAGLFAGVVAVLRIAPPIPLPGSPVPITLQTFGVMLTGTLLGARTGGLAMLTFLFLVLAGAPVLATGHTGPGVFLGPTGGYVLSWPLAAYIIGWIVERRRGRYWWYVVANIVGGILVVYTLGVTVMAVVTGLGVTEALVAGALVFIPGDVVKALAAGAVAMSLQRILPRSAGTARPSI